jgi:outer membrane protein
MSFRKPMNVKQVLFTLLLISFCVLILEDTIAQKKLTLSDAVEIAQQSSRNIKKSQLNLYGNQRSLDAQRLALKSRFALDVTPFDYNRARSFNDLFSRWNTNKDYNSFANLSVSQPIYATDGRISLINRLGYRDN